MKMAVKIIAIDDHRISLLGMHTLFSADGECELVAAVSGISAACDYLAGAGEKKAQVALLDLRMGDSSDPFDNVQRLQALGLAVIIFSSLDSPFLIRRALQAGVQGVVSKTATDEEIVQAVLTVHQNNTFANVDWASAIDSDPLLNSVDLSPRQLQVLELYASGESAKRVARITNLSVDTVQDYINRIRRKYCAAGRPTTSKTDLYLRGLEDGYIAGPADA